jgi:hypothetical protein
MITLIKILGRDKPLPLLLEENRMEINIPESWHAHLNGELNKPYFQKLSQFVD